MPTDRRRRAGRDGVTTEKPKHVVSSAEDSAVENSPSEEFSNQSSSSNMFWKALNVGKYVVLLLLLPAILNHAALLREAQYLIPPGGELYDIGWGQKLLLSCNGTGPPTVLLDAPTGMSSDVWYFIQPELAKVTRVCTYDRAGIGFSERAPRNASDSNNSLMGDSRAEEFTVERMVDDLHQLLTVSSDQPKPFIFVGSELGSLVARFYTQLYENEVSDLILIDPLVEGLFSIDKGIWGKFWFDYLIPSYQSLQLSAAVGASRIGLLLNLMNQPMKNSDLPEDVDYRQKYLMCQPHHLSTVVDEHYFINASLSQISTAWRIKPFPKHVGVTVVTGNYYDEQLPNTLNKAWAKAQQHLISNLHPGSKHILLNGADHTMPYRNPKALLEPIRRIVRQRKLSLSNGKPKRKIEFGTVDR
ncbi:uncharacterized protein LOC117123821 [Anneissia japonica]|uniref:uncharacterized protein LOC117123821 n=1 Tax=Anneissia japonica TaxID=1529436 RepID=UPI00142565C3|nr:uncharacterized protein LOC117123821 [Anneissia japonica]